MKVSNGLVLGLIFFLISPIVSRADGDPSCVEANGILVVYIGERRSVNGMAVYPRTGIVNRPLLIMAHGNGGSGVEEIKRWTRLSDKDNFTIVCPTFLSSVNSMYILEDMSYFQSCLHWVEENLQYDRNNVYMSGFSGGGFAVWYLGTTRPDVIKGLFLQSGNFAGECYSLDLSKWRDRPIKIIWGSKDLPDIPIQNNEALKELEFAGCHQSIIEVIRGAGHQEHPDLLIHWMKQSADLPMPRP